MTNKTPEEIAAIMDGMRAAAEVARKEFNELYSKHPEAVTSLGLWWKNNFGDAGHKRLAYILMQKPYPERR